MDTSKENLDPFVGFIRERFQQAETARLYDEKRWLKAYRNYRGYTDQKWHSVIMKNLKFLLR